jgi:hypothetical protein
LQLLHGNRNSTSSINLGGGSSGYLLLTSEVVMVMMSNGSHI